MPSYPPSHSDSITHKADYTRGEEIANVLSALIGLLAAIAAAPFFLAKAGQSHDWLVQAGVIVFLGATIVMYATSALYHALPPGATKHQVRLLDHSAIFLLIAGTYTPLTVGPLRHEGGLILLAIEWTLVVVGVLIKILGGFRQRHLSNALYLLMGWAGILWVRPFIHHVTMEGFLWVLGGGIAYTVGTIFYIAKTKPYTHLVWHLFVFAGTCCHAYAIWRYVL